MYTIYVDDQLLYSPTLVHEGYAVLNPKLTLELNKAGSLTFLLPPNNVQYDNISKLKSVITVYQDDEEIFRGRVLHDTRDFHNRKDVYCEGELSFLLDSIMRPYSYENITLQTLFNRCINFHNGRVDSFKQFKPGIFEGPSNIDVSPDTTNTNTSAYTVLCVHRNNNNGIDRHSTNYTESDGTYTCSKCGTKFTLSKYGVPKNVNENGYMIYDDQDNFDGSKYVSTIDDQIIVYVRHNKRAPEEQQKSTAYTNTLDFINTNFIEKYGGYLRIRVFKGVRYLDYVQEYGEIIDQTIEFGVNLLDISEYISADEVFTVLIPLGSESNSSTDNSVRKYRALCAYCENEEMSFSTDDDGNVTEFECDSCGKRYVMSEWGVPMYDLGGGVTTPTRYWNTKTIDGVEYKQYNYVGFPAVYLKEGTTSDSSSGIITIENAVDTSLLPEGIIKNKDCLEHEAAISEFGRICRSCTWDGVSDPYELMKLGASCLQSNIEKAVTLTCKAVDLHFLNVDTERIKLGSYVRVISLPHNIDRNFLCSQIVMDLANPEKTEYTLGANHTTFTSKQTDTTKVVTNTADAIRNTAASNATLNEDMKVVKTELSNKTPMTQASIFKILTNNGKVQGMVMDEETGDIYINASYIKSGTLTLGGSNPLMEVVNEDDVVCVRVGKDGIHILDGEINATSGTLENMSIVNGITISSKDGGVDKVPLISIEPYDDGSGKKLYQIIFGYDNSDPNKGNTTVVFDFDDVHLKNALHFDRDNTEKQIHFKTKTDDGTYRHKCKIYGGNAESPIGIGVYSYEGDDGNEVKRVWAYDDQQKHLVSDVPLASYDLNITLGDGASSVDNRSICQQLTRAARLHAKFTSKAISANTTTTLGTISTNYAPKGFDVILSAYTAKTVCDVFLTAKGYIKIKAPNAIPAGESIFIDGSWIY